ncbi:Uncharacterised protein [Leclercia adecarboxylata]|uniref:Uncharacterized protein n=1 Tax=Leclercia adecarboxylata TaxID=83655 RepID=A0A4U9HX82_9ENTR|nr:Uncharacterised protein [Leclercia adecarboxylata]
MTVIFLLGCRINIRRWLRMEKFISASTTGKIIHTLFLSISICLSMKWHMSGSEKRDWNVIGRGLVSWAVSYHYVLDSRYLSEYPMEQQAQIIADHFILNAEGYTKWCDLRDQDVITLDGNISEADYPATVSKYVAGVSMVKIGRQHHFSAFLFLFSLPLLTGCPGDRWRFDEETTVSIMGGISVFAVPDAEDYQPVNIAINPRGNSAEPGEYYLSPGSKNRK